jgi:hypothetical protein
MFLLRADKLLIARRKNILSTEKNIFLRAENIITARSYFFSCSAEKIRECESGRKNAAGKDLKCSCILFRTQLKSFCFSAEFFIYSSSFGFV